MHKLALNSSLLTVGSYGAQVATVLAYWIAASHMAPALFGPLLAAIGLALLSVTVADFGMNAWSVRTIAAGEADRDFFGRTLGAKFALAILLGLAWVAALVVLALRDPYAFQLLPLAAYVSLSILTATLSVPLRARQDMKQVAAIAIVEKIVALAFALIMFNALRPALAIYLASALTIGAMASVAYSASITRGDRRGWVGPSLGELRSLWKSSIGFGVAGLASQLQRADVALVAIVAGPAAAAIYGAPARITGALGVLPTAFSQVVYPHVSALPGRRTAYRDALIGGVAVLGVMVVLLGGAFLIARPLVALSLGGGYAESATVLRIILVGMVLASINGPLSVFLQAERQEAFVGRVIGIASVVGLTAVGVGAAGWGPIGASFGLLVLQGLSSVLLIAKFIGCYQRLPAGLAKAS